MNSILPIVLSLTLGHAALAASGPNCVRQVTDTMILDYEGAYGEQVKRVRALYGKIFPNWAPWQIAAQQCGVDPAISKYIMQDELDVLSVTYGFSLK